MLVVIAIIAILAAVLFPVFAAAKAKAKQVSCLQNLRQQGIGMRLYLSDYDDLLPDRRDLKTSLPGGYMPWTGWPPSDPRAGWASTILDPYLKNAEIWQCPSGKDLFRTTQQAKQEWAAGKNTFYWMWRFDRTDNPVPLDNLWGKSEDQAVTDLRQANNPQVGLPEGVSEVELTVDPYFPRTIPSVPAAIKGKAAHVGGRNRLFLDLHAKYAKDPRLD